MSIRRDQWAKTGLWRRLWVLPLFCFGALAMQRSVYRYDVKVELVGVFATVVDASGKVATELTEDDFVIYDNGERQRISQFSRDYIPLSVVILLDASSSMDGKKLENARKALARFLNKLQNGDEAMLIAFRTRPDVVQAFTRDVGKIRRSLKSLEAGGSTALYDAILAALNALREARNARRALLLISDGINTHGKAELPDTIAHLRRHGGELFAIGLEGGFPEDLRDNALTRSVLHQLTGSAGGEAFIVNDARQIGKTCDLISERMRHQYSFGYYPLHTQDRGWHSVRVESRLPGYKVLTSKRGYYLSDVLIPTDAEGR